MSDNPISADNQQERLRKILTFDDPFKWYLSGFVDGEGSFCISIKKHPNCAFGWQIDPSFYLYQHERHLWLLEQVKLFFGAGCIHRKSNPSTVFTYALHGIRHARTKVIPFFRQYPLHVKSETFTLFAQAVDMMEQKVHHQKQGFEKVVRIAHMLNQMGKGRKWTLDRIFAESSETARQTRENGMIQSDPHSDMRSMAEMSMPSGITIPESNNHA